MKNKTVVKKLEQIKNNINENIEQNIETVKIIIDTLNKTSDKAYELEAKLTLVNLHWANRNLEKTMNTSIDLLNDASSYGFIKYVSYAYMFLGNVYFYLENYTTAIEMYKKGLSFLDKKDYPILECSLLNNAGEVYKIIGSYKKAHEYYNKSFDIANAVKNYKYMAVSYINISETYLKEETFQKAIIYARKSEKCFIKSEYKIGLGYTYSVYAQILVELKSYDQAITYYQKAIEHINTCNDTQNRLSVGLKLLDAYEKLERNKDFQKEAKYLYELSIKVSSKYFIGQTALSLSKYHENCKNYKKALDYYKIYNSNHILSQEEILSSKISSTKKELQMKQAEKEKKRYKKKNKELAILNKELNRLTNTDDLTQIPNRRSFIEYLNNAIIEASKSKNPLTLIIIDVDRFKEYNDNYGHLKGDSVLKKIANILSLSIKYKDGICARYGGDEFVIVLNNSNFDDAINFSNNLINLFKKANMKHNFSDISDHITITGGSFTQIPSATYDSEKCMHEADRNLYKAKKKGRNNIICTHS